MIIKINTLLCLLTMGIALQANAQSSLQQAANRLASDPSLKHGTLALCVIEVKTGKSIATVNEMRSVVPASTQKLITTATAVNLMGADYGFKTQLEYSGNIDAKGNLNGSLYLKGFGDPTLGSPLMEGGPSLEEVMDELALAVQRAGISHIKGQVIGDATAFESGAYGRTWQWEDMGNYYGVGAWGLNLHENLHYLTFRQQPGLGQRPPIEKVEPEVPGLQFTNELKTAARGTGDNAYIFGAPYQFDRYVRGTIPAGAGTFTIKGSVPNPPLWAAQLLEQRLQAIGITAGGAASLISAPPISGRTVLYTHTSPALRTIVERANMKSVNLYCEAMIKALPMNKGEEGSTEAGLDLLFDHWKSKGLNTDGVRLQDGSGLSEANRVTALFMAQLLAKMAASGGSSFEAFYESIPVAGRSGSMKNRLKGTAAEGRLLAKSGTLESVRGLAGYARTPGGKLLAYAVIANDYTGSGGQMRQKLEQFLVRLCR